MKKSGTNKETATFEKSMITIERLTIDDASLVFEWVMRLLNELGEEGDELGELAVETVLSKWREAGELFQVFAAKDEGSMVGILTLTETFAIYANGNYGIINEMYVDHPYRSQGVGFRLVEAAKQYALLKGWSRLDVTAPESERWARTRKFYENAGFVFTGPKLKLLLKS